MQRHIQMVRDLVRGCGLHLRSPQWPEMEKKHLAEEPKCQWCLGTEKLQVHHRMPFHLDPSKELDDNNLITLCEVGGDENCHFIRGHARNWKSYVSTVREDCDAHQKLLKGSTSSASP